MGDIVDVELFAAAGFGITIVGLCVEHFHYLAGNQEKVGVLEARVKDLENDCMRVAQMANDMAEVKTKVNLFWGALEDQLPGMLLKGNPIPEDSELFGLLKRYQNGGLSWEELAQLSCKLDLEAKSGNHRPGEVLAMMLLKATIEAKSGGKIPCWG